MSNQKPKQSKPVPESAPSPPPAPPEQKEPPTTTFTEIGGSPIPGLTLRHVLRGHTSWIARIAWSPDGEYPASASDDKTICQWDAVIGIPLQTLKGHASSIRSIAWSPDGHRLASAAYDNTVRLWDIRLWDAASREAMQVLEGHSTPL